MKKKSKWIATIMLGVAFIVVTAFWRGSFDYQSQITIHPLNASSSSNSHFLSLAITNQSPSTILYSVTKPQEMSNGVWPKLAIPTTTLDELLPGQGTTIQIAVPPPNAEFRVPVLWGFYYVPETPKWQQMKDEFLGRLSGRNPRGLGSLYTNYVSNPAR